MTRLAPWMLAGFFAGSPMYCVQAVAQQSDELGIKHISLTNDGSVYLSLSGELRERFEYYSEPFFGLRGVDEDSYLLHRLLLGADLHAGDHARVFLQIGNHLEGGK